MISVALISLCFGGIDLSLSLSLFLSPLVIFDKRHMVTPIDETFLKQIAQIDVNAFVMPKL